MGGDPVRMCLSCRRRAPKIDLVRVVAADGTIVVDDPARRPGRGAYLCPRQECLDAALQRDGAALLRALRRHRGQVRVDGSALGAAWRAHRAPGRADGAAGGREACREWIA